MSALRQELTRLRQQIDALEERIGALENDDGSDIDIQAWIERNKEALNESFKKDDEAMERGEYIEGTVEELRARFLSELRNAK